MSYKTVFTIILFFVATNTFAAKSIMFEDQDDNYYGSENTPSEQEQKKTYCNNLKQQIADLKGKPLRRTEVKKRYQEECLGKRRDSTY